MIDEQEFRVRCDAALEDLYKALGRAADQHEFDPDMNNGALSVAFEDPPAKFVVSPQAPVRQVWVSAHAKSFKFDWDPGRGDFVLSETGDSLKQMMAKAISQQLGEPVSL